MIVPRALISLMRRKHRVHSSRQRQWAEAQRRRVIDAHVRATIKRLRPS